MSIKPAHNDPWGDESTRTLLVQTLLNVVLIGIVFLAAGLLAGGAVARVTRVSVETPLPEALPEIPTAAPTPTVEPLPSAEPPAPGIIRLFFTGDLNPGRCPAQAALLANDFTLPYQLIAEELRSADITIGSLDGSISDIAPPAPCAEVLNLIGPSRTAEGLAFAGFDVLTVATNHALDCGSLGWFCDGKALDETRQNLSNAGIEPVGIGKTLNEARAPVIIERQGVRFAFLAVNAISGESTWASDSRAGTAPLSEAVMAEVQADIVHARALADVVIVLPHWGVEYTQLPDLNQRVWAEQMITAGADLIIGNHTHIVQPAETYPNGAVTAYSLGNFVFDQGPIDTRQGVVFEAVFRGSKLESWQFLPVIINRFFQPRWADTTQAQAILKRISEVGQTLQVLQGR